VSPSLRRITAWLGRVGQTFVILLVAYLALSLLAPSRGFTTLVGLGCLITGVWLAIRLLRLAMRHAVWRLRNRLIVTYLFMAFVPVLLVVVLASLGGWLLLTQLTVYLVNNELDRRIATLQTMAENLGHADVKSRVPLAGEVRALNQDRYPSLEIVLGMPGGVQREPANGTEPHPQPEWKSASGVLVRQNRYFLWAYYQAPEGDVTISAPLSGDWLAGLVPNLGPVTFAQAPAPGVLINFAGTRERGSRGTSVVVPPPVNRFDSIITWFAYVPTLDAEKPNQGGPSAIIAVRSRVSAVMSAVFNRAADDAQTAIKITMVAVTMIFIIVSLIALTIGVTMTRTITGAVHRLYDGTLKIREGEFSHRITVSGRDQLGELANSFNQMTENLERLLVVAKEKERLQSEIEIAREVQARLFPRTVPELATLRLKAVCHPARMVSGDYYDYELIHGTQVALTIADVAGKGISAALLMASLQSSLRSQLEDSLEAAVAAGNGSASHVVSTSRLVSRLNRQLHASTSPEKFATFCLGIYDQTSSVLTYTNAGHLPPMLIRKGSVERLEVNGTVVGAFSFAKFTESQVELQSNDLLVFFTDGITEPENEYGEMFGEDRLSDLVARNAHRSEEEIIDLVLESVRRFARAGEAQDDMTILLARRV
jgi:sigma-B regulation protein RsbU (phosphoserine phosphatase)